VLSRAAAILRALKHQNQGLSLGQIAKRGDLPRSTVQRLVTALQAEGMLAAGRDGGVRLGPEILSLAEGGRIEVIEVARPHLISLSSQTGETIDLAHYRGDHIVFVDQIVGEHRLRAVSAVGGTFPLTSTANGKACLSLLQDEDVELAYRSERPAQSFEDFVREIREIRTTKLAFDKEEHTSGIKAVGTAIRDRNNEIFAISIPVPALRFDEGRDRFAAALARTRAELQAMLT
jgi:DNA-binding IclR family transcriptional regulator